MQDEQDDSPRAAPRPSLRRRILTGTLWSMLGIAALGLTRLIYTAMIGRTGTPGRLAEVNAQISLAFVATFVTAAATGTAAAKFIPLVTARSGPSEAAAVHRRLGLWTILWTTLATLVTAPLGLVLLSSADLGDVVWLGALVAAYGAYTFTKSTLYGYHRAGRYAALEVLADIGTLSLTVLVVTTGWNNSDVLLAPLVLGYAGFAVAAVLSTPRDRPSTIDAETAREMRGFVVYTALGTVASQGFFQISMVVANGLAGGGDAGLYAAAMSLVTPAFFLPRAMALAFFPAAAEAVGQGDGEGLIRQTGTLTRMLWVTMLPVFVLAAIVGGPVLRLVFGPAYDGGGTMLALLLAGVFLYVIAVPSVNALSARELRHARIPPLASACGVVVGTLVWLVATPQLGAEGIALGYLAGLLVQAGTPLTIVTKLSFIGPRGWVLLAAGAVAAGLAVTTSNAVVIVPSTAVFLALYARLARGELGALWARTRTLEK